MIMNSIKAIARNVIPEPWLVMLKKWAERSPLRAGMARMSSFVRDGRNFTELNRMLDKDRGKNADLYRMFESVDDDFWFWSHTCGYANSPVLSGIMPKMPEEELQLQFTGLSGYRTLKEAFLFYKLIKSTLLRRGISLGPGKRVLDFGCGWGRIVRFFLKDVPEKDLYCSDCDGDIIKVCRGLNIKADLSVNDPYPPINFQDDYFDLIYSFSVFSHLSEQAHKRWLSEFRRILKPGGMFIATTRPRDFILWCEKARKMREVTIAFQGAASAFVNAKEKFREYDSGNYVYDPVGGGGVREGSFYGEACIPEKYVRAEWMKYFKEVDFVDYKEHGCFNQNLIVAKK